MSATSHYSATPFPHRQDTLYYDASCPLCAKEITHLTRLQKGTLICADLHTELPVLLTEQKENMLKVLHLYTHDGRCLLGLDATVRAWQHTAFGWIFAWLRWPLIKPIADKCYTQWADQRYRKKYDCHPCNIK
ncbi:thiol-disulfide oxidoreductase DCC family protein [Eionea flava]